MRSPNVIVLGSINSDLVIQGRRLPGPGETVLGGSYFSAHGGKGANQAVAAGRASHGRVTLLAAVGDDTFGRATLEALQSEPVDSKYIKIVGGHPTGVALIMVDASGENMISVAPGANGQLGADDVGAIPDEVFEQAGVFLASLECPWEGVLRGLRRARSFGLTTILNPAPAPTVPLTREELASIDVITPNRGEAAQLTGCTTDTLEGVRQAARALRERGCGACVVTLGAEGGAIEDGEFTSLAAPKVEAVDTTAAGDAFNGALAVAMAEGLTLRDAANWASFAAALAVTGSGAQPSLARRAAIDDFAARGR